MCLDSLFRSTFSKITEKERGAAQLSGGGGVSTWGGRRKGRRGIRGKADTTETGGGRWMIYASEVAIQPG